MIPTVRREYDRLRAKGWTAEAAFRAATVTARFAQLEEQGLVRFRVVEDPEPYDSSHVDTWTDMRPSDRKRWKEDIARDIRRYGVVGLVGEILVDDCWVGQDSVWGCIGNDTHDNGYDTDIKLACIEALAERGAAALRDRPTYAAGGQS